MEPNVAKGKSICSPNNYKRFAEKFKEENRGQGPYVDALGTDAPYVPTLPGMHDYTAVKNYGYAEDDPLFNKERFTNEKIYKYVHLVAVDVTIEIPDNSPDAKEGATMSHTIQRDELQWTTTGREAFVKAQTAAEKTEREDRAKRDQCVARLLAQLSPESRTLLNNMKGANAAIDNNDLWLIFNQLLPQSHNQVSTSAVAKRTRLLLSSTQDTSFPSFTESFAREAQQFTSDWESSLYPGYIKADALLCNVFIEAVREGVDSTLLKPCLEYIALLSAGDHRDAKLCDIQDALSSYYIRNKPSASVEESVAFQSLQLSSSTTPASLCISCTKGTCVSVKDLTAIVAGLPKPAPRVASFMNHQLQSRFCRSCIITPPHCACGQAKRHAFHKFCGACYKQQARRDPARQPRRDPAPSPAKALSAPAASPGPPVPPVSLPPTPPDTSGSVQHYYPPMPHPHWGAPPYHHPSTHGYPISASYPPPPTPPHEDDALSDYSSVTNRGYCSALCERDWANFQASDAYAHLTATLHNDPSVCDNTPSVPLTARLERHTYYVDSAASMHCTDSLAHLAAPTALATPITITGINGTVVEFTHVGDLLWLPPGMRRCFYSPTLGARLISLAYMCRDRRTHFYNDPDHHAMVLVVDGAHFSTCTQSKNNLYPFPVEGRGVFYPPSVPHALAASSPFSLRNYTPEQLARCDKVETLLNVYCRPSDAALADTISYGGLGPHAAGLTADDVHLNRLLRGPDIYRAQSRVRDPPAVASTSLPAPSPCHTLVVDPHHLKHADIFGNTCKLNVVCEFTGAFWVLPAKSGTAPHLHVALERFIHSVCNASGHRVRYVHADAESVLKNLVAPLGKTGITVLLAPPGHHAKRVERYTQTFNERKRMLLAQLPHTTAPTLGLDVFLDMHVATSMRSLVNTTSHPNTPDELVTRQRTPVNGLHLCPFGSLVLVRMGDQKRAAIAAKLLVPVQQAPQAELAMCLGRAPSNHPASYYMYVPSTHKVVIRRHFKAISVGTLPPFCVPNPTYLRPVQAPAHLMSPLPSDDSIQGHPIQHPEVASQLEQLLPPIPIDLVEGTDLPLPPGLDDTSMSFLPLASGSSPLTPVVAQPLTAATRPSPPAVCSPPAPVPSTPAVPPLVDHSKRKLSTPRHPPSHPVPPVTPVGVPSYYSPIDNDTPATTEPSGSPSLVRNLLPQFIPDQPASTPIVVSPPAIPMRRASSRSNFGRPPPRFDNSAALSQRQRKTALLAARAQARHAFCAATWHDICSFDGPPVPPDPHGGRAFTVPRPIRTGVARPVALVAGSRRSVPCVPRCKSRPLLPLFVRHICFLTLLNQVHIPSITSSLPPFNAFSASPLLTTDSGPATTPLAFSPKDNKEMTYRQGVKSMRPDELRAAVAKELDKLFNTHQAIRPIDQKDIRAHAVRIYSSMLVKAKYFGDGSFDRISARLAAGGNTQPEHSFDSTYAPTADESSTLCVFASFAAHSTQHGYSQDICYSNFDVKGAFLWVPRSNQTQIIMRLPSYIDHPSAGRDVEVLKSIYGLKDSNANFDADLRKTIVSAGFHGTLDPCIYTKVAPNPANPAIPLRCIVSTHVDDGRAMYNHRAFYDDLITTLEERYGPLSKDDNTTSYTGSTFDAAPDGSFTITQEGYVGRLLASTNQPDLPVRSTPSDDDLFSDTSASPHCNPRTYRQLVGSLIHLLRTRYDIQKEVVHLSSKMSLPTEGDMAKGLKVLQYLKGSPAIGPRYHTTEGPVLYVYVDASYAVHHDGRSQTGFSFHIGRHSAPFYVKAGKQTECVSVGSMEAEYVALSQAGRKILEFRYLLEDVGFPQTQPTTIFEDNMSAINLAIAPHVTRKSRHIHTRHHFIRDLVNQQLVKVCHLPTQDMLADFFTKSYGPKRFRLARDRLFNPPNTDSP
jgi:hypothetical protein